MDQQSSDDLEEHVDVPVLLDGDQDANDAAQDEDAQASAEEVSSPGDMIADTSPADTSSTATPSATATAALVVEEGGNTAEEEKVTAQIEPDITTNKGSELPDVPTTNEAVSESKEEPPAPKVVQPVVEQVKRDPNLVSVTLRAVDNGWVMGEDWVVDFHNLMTMGEIRTFVEQHRGISRHRIQLRLKGKVLPTNREIWTLRRMGIYDGYTILIEPTIKGGWLWESKDYYCNKLLNEVCAIIENTVTANGAGRINMKVLSEKIKPPPCIKTSLRVFLRQYPERVYIHTDTSDNDLWVHVPKRPFQLPTFGNFSVEIGTFPYFKPKHFNWAANKEIDDMYKIETLPEEEEEVVVEEGKEAEAAALAAALPSPEELARQAVLASEQSARNAALNDTESYVDDLGEESFVTGNDDVP